MKAATISGCLLCTLRCDSIFTPLTPRQSRCLHGGAWQAYLPEAFVSPGTFAGTWLLEVVPCSAFSLSAACLASDTASAGQSTAIKTYIAQTKSSSSKLGRPAELGVASPRFRRCCCDCRTRKTPFILQSRTQSCQMVRNRQSLRSDTTRNWTFRSRGPQGSSASEETLKLTAQIEASIRPMQDVESTSNDMLTSTRPYICSPFYQELCRSSQTEHDCR